MDIQFIAINLPDRPVAIMQVIGEVDVCGLPTDVAIAHGFSLVDGKWRREITDAVIDAEIKRTPSLVSASGWTRVSKADIPADRSFRGAWSASSGGLGVDMVKARNIHRQNLRHLREPKLEALDIDYQRADEDGDVNEKARIASLKQALRDVTIDPAIEAAVTPEHLTRSVPDILST